jgi:hypothetical protein
MCWLTTAFTVLDGRGELGDDGVEVMQYGHAMLVDGRVVFTMLR